MSLEPLKPTSAYHWLFVKIIIIFGLLLFFKTTLLDVLVFQARKGDIIKNNIFFSLIIISSFKIFILETVL